MRVRRMTRCYIDFETRSTADIKKVGGRIYAEHPSTEILCVAWAEDDGPVHLLERDYWTLTQDGVYPICELDAIAEDPDIIFVAHNAPFEQAVWENIMVKRLGFSPIPIERWRCTLSKAFAHGLPGSLEGCGAALDSPFPKDMAGNKVMMKLCKPRRQTLKNSKQFWEYDDAPEDFEKLYEYCKRDVEAERWIDKHLRDLSPYEQRVWQIDQRMNQEGIYVDTHLVNNAISLADAHKEVLALDFAKATGGAVAAPSQRANLLMWLKDNGLSLPDTQKATITKARGRQDLSPAVAESLRILAESSRTSIAKYGAFLQRSSGSVIRETLQYSGAHTRRWTGRGVQIQNMARPNGLDVEVSADAIRQLSYEGFSLLYSDPIGALSRTSRGAIIARPGKTFMGGDFGQIESRVNAWLAGQTDKLDAFRNGEDLYCTIASKIYGYPVNKTDHPFERQVGKVADLAFGYQGGIAAGANMARGYGLDISPVAGKLWESASPEERKNAEYCYLLYIKGEPEDPVSQEVGFAFNIIKQRYRAAHPKIVQLWEDLETAAIEAVQTGEAVQCGKVRFFTDKEFLWCKLPGGGFLAYPFPRVEVGSRGKMTLTYKTEYLNKWIRTTTYGGSLCENLVQAIARDLLVHVMVRLESIFPVLFHVHDELISEVLKAMADLEKFLAIMREPPDWGADIPIAVDGWIGTRYGVK